MAPTTLSSANRRDRRDRRDRRRIHPHATGGRFTIHSTWRLYIVAGAAFVVVVLVIVDLIT